MSEISSLILCGGDSRRMGRDKATLQLEGQPLAARLAARLSPLGPVRLSVRTETQCASLGLPRLYDPVPDAGPLAGLCAGLRAAETELLFVTACDLPNVDAGTARALIAALGAADAAVPVDAAGRPQPLCAVYRRRCLGAAEEALARRELRLRELLGRLNVSFVRAAALPGGERSLENWNTPEDLREQ